MADVFLLPATTYQPPPAPSQDRRSGRALNTIMEEEDIEDVPAFADRRIRNNNSHNEKIEAWLSPLSDHFPTPRGFHFLAAPVLPSSPSTYSADETASPATSSNPWNNRSSVMTDSTEFDDLYDDISSEDEDAKRMAPIARKPSLKRQASVTARKTSLPPLVIPATRQNTSEPFSGADLKKITSPVPPTPPIKVQLSPEVMTFLHAQQAQEIPTISAPPSLDGSLSSEQMAQMSAPPTPMLAGKDEDRDEDWSGLQLQPNALATLQALSGESDSLDGHELQSEAVIEFPEEPVSEMRQSGLRLITNFAVQPQVSNGTPANHRHSMNGLSALDIPSPGGFFSGLSPRTRTTWHMPTINPDDIAPPTSTTAEEFYRLPWNADKTAPPVPAVPAKPAMPMEEEFYRSSFSSFSATVPVEQIIEVNSQLNDEDDFPTARPIFAQQSTVGSRSGAEPSSPSVEVVPTEIIVDYDPEYARKQQEVALGNLDRTELWLMAQRAYLKPVHGEDEQQLPGLTSIPEAVEEEVKKPAEAEAETADSTTGNKKKTVRFSEMIVTSDVPRQLPSKVYKQESTYYRAFQDYIIRSRAQDVFVHKLPRFESLQAQRVSLREAHRNQLLGKYQLSVVPQSAKKRLSANVARGDDVLVDDFAKLKSEKEAEAMGQMNMSTWHVAAVKMLNGGKLISAPVAKRLGRISRMAPGPHGVARDRARILDLGGQATCDWAWHCAMQYPNTKVYTVTTKAIRQLSNSNIRGPPNHRQVAVDSLTRLPFDDDQFDLVSARELHTMLKFVGENGEDEWESCLKEVMRVLKPGGYIEFSVLDSDIMNAGPLGLAKSVEFGFNLKTLGYDPAPTKSWLGRLSRAGFEDVRRAWTFMPMGERHRGRADMPPPVPLKDSPTGDEVRTHSLEAMVSGSGDHVASICGLVGSWSWERWLLRCEMERVSGELRLVDTVTAGAAMLEADMCLDNVAAIVEEGRDCGAGWRMLTGYARKPRAGMDFIPIFVES